jgi:hypothetical protein
MDCWPLTNRVDMNRLIRFLDLRDFAFAVGGVEDDHLQSTVVNRPIRERFLFWYTKDEHEIEAKSDRRNYHRGHEILDPHRPLRTHMGYARWAHQEIVPSRPPSAATLQPPIYYPELGLTPTPDQCILI